MIISFSIQNFGSIREKQTISFEATKLKNLEEYYIVEPIPGLRLLKLALIYGANASGKTTILNALLFLRNLTLNPQEKKTTQLAYEPFLFDEESYVLNTVLSIEFVQNRVRYFYEIEFNKSAVVKEQLYFHNPNKAKIFSRTTNLEKQFTQISFGSKIKQDRVSETSLEANTLWNNSVLGGYLKTNINLPELKEVSAWFSNFLGKAITPDTDIKHYITRQISNTVINKETVIEILKQADFNISDITITEEKFHLPQEQMNLFESRGVSAEALETIKQSTTFTYEKITMEHTVNDVSYHLPFEQESQGTKRYYELAGLLAMLITKPNALSIDELESSLHPALFNHFIISFLINAKHSQLIATTHYRQ